MKISKKRLANKVRKLEVQNYDMRQKIKKMDKALTCLDELTTELNHALPDPEYDAECEENAVAVEESLARHAVRLGLVKPKPKQLDQSVFDHKYVTSHFHYAAINANGRSIFFSDKPKYNLELGIWYSTAGSTMPMLKGYDTTNWQNSLIERENIADELLEIDLGLPSVCETCGSTMQNLHKGEWS